MKRCSKCKQLKPETEFYKNAIMKDGLQHQCKKCHNEYTTEYMRKHKITNKQRQEKKDERNFNKYLGGYKISILNHIKKGEYKYVIFSTNGQSFMTNDNIDFMKKIKELTIKK